MKIERYVEGVEVFRAAAPRRPQRRPVTAVRSLADQMGREDACAAVASALPYMPTHDFLAENTDGGVRVASFERRSRQRGEAIVSKREVLQAKAQGPDKLRELVEVTCRKAIRAI